MITEKAYLSVRDLMDELDIGETTAYELVNTDGFPAVRIGKRYVIPRVELDAWICKAARERRFIQTGGW